MTTSERKQSMRLEAKARIADMKDEMRHAASERIQDSVLGSDEYQWCEELFVYLAFGSEIRTERLLEQAWSDRKKVLVPAFNGDSYSLVEHFRDDRMESGNYGIREPQEKRLCQPCGNILAIVPGLAFDRQGRRLGRGGGYYDRILDGVRRGGADLVTFGLIYHACIVPEVPVEAFDFGVDVVVTEKESIRALSVDGAGIE